jgi:hypothetical protein
VFAKSAGVNKPTFLSEILLNSKIFCYKRRPTKVKIEA